MCCEFFGEVAHVAICGADDGKQEYKQTCICGKNCTVLGLTDVAELGAWVQDEVFHVVRVIIRSPGGRPHPQNGPKKTDYNGPPSQSTILHESC